MDRSAGGDWPYHDGEMARRIRRHDWASTSLGPAEAWPQSLKTTVELMLGASHLAQMAYGPELLLLYNDAYAPLLGDKHPAALGRPYAEVWPGDRFQGMVGGVMAGRSFRFTDEPYVIASRTENPVGWFTGGWSPLRSEAGQVVGFLATGFESSEGVLAYRRQTILLRELQHRVRNTLAMVRSIVRRTAQTTETAQEVSERLEGRIDALARTQAMLTRSAGAGMDLEMLVRDELLAQAAEEARTTVEGPSVVLAPNAAEVLTLAIHELATNAVKYGALGGGGALSVRWRITQAGEGETPWLRFDWVETGVRVLAPAPRPYGFGSELLERRVPYELKGEGRLELKPQGMHASIGFPLQAVEGVFSSEGAAWPAG